jgi:hypothetical protein
MTRKSNTTSNTVLTVTTEQMGEIVNNAVAQALAAHGLTADAPAKATPASMPKRRAAKKATSRKTAKKAVAKPARVIECDTCGTTVTGATANQKRCAECREARQGDYLAKRAEFLASRDPEVAAKVKGANRKLAEYLRKQGFEPRGDVWTAARNGTRDKRSLAKIAKAEADRLAQAKA